MGVDPVAHLLDLAPEHPAVEYRTMVPGRIPLEDGAADVVWVCLVLGGITERRVLAATVHEIERVLRPGGVLLLAECTNRRADAPTGTTDPSRRTGGCSGRSSSSREASMRSSTTPSRCSPDAVPPPDSRGYCMPVPPPLPPPNRKAWGRVRGMVSSFAAMYDWSARFDLFRAKLRSRLGQGGNEVVSLRVKELDGRELHVRPGTADMNTIFLNYVQGAHLPPPGVAHRDLQQICELGSQIGTGLAGLCARYPNASVLGVEPDTDNAELARRNVAAFGSRCRVVQTAIWDTETEMTIEGEWVSGFSVRPSHTGDPPDRRIRRPTVEQLLAEHMPSGEIDYLVMNLEGTEPRVLAAAASWASRVTSIRCEIYRGRASRATTRWCCSTSSGSNLGGSHGHHWDGRSGYGVLVVAS